MDIKEIKRLVKLVEEANVSHLSIEENGQKIEIKKEGTPIAAPSTIQVPVAAPQQPAPQAQAAPEATESAEPEDDKDLIPIKAQMVGTFYLSPNPEAPSYVKTGDSISKGQVICIIEAMKLFNEIESEIEGTIEKICVENAAPVEYGQTLFLVRP